MVEIEALVIRITPDFDDLVSEEDEHQGQRDWHRIATMTVCARCAGEEEMDAYIPLTTICGVYVGTSEDLDVCVAEYISEEQRVKMETALMEYSSNCRQLAPVDLAALPLTVQVLTEQQ